MSEHNHMGESLKEDCPACYPIILKARIELLTAERDAALQQAASWEQHIPKFMVAVRDETAKAARRKAKQNRADGNVEQSFLMDTIADIMEALSVDELVVNLEKQS